MTSSWQLNWQTCALLSTTGPKLFSVFPIFGFHKVVHQMDSKSFHHAISAFMGDVMSNYNDLFYDLIKWWECFIEYIISIVVMGSIFSLFRPFMFETNSRVDAQTQTIQLENRTHKAKTHQKCVLFFLHHWLPAVWGVIAIGSLLSDLQKMPRHISSSLAMITCSKEGPMIIQKFSIDSNTISLGALNGKKKLV